MYLGLNKNIKELDAYSILLIGFSISYYGVIFYLAYNLNVWIDEVVALNTSSGTLSYAIQQSFNYELQPPVYFILLTIWRIISLSIIWSRLLSVVFIIIAQIYLYKFSLKVVGYKIATIISMLFLLNPYTLFAILEIRVYALVLMISILIIITFYNSYYSAKYKAGSRILYITLAILGLFTQYYVGFLLFANAAVLLTEKKYKALYSYILDMSIPLIVLLFFVGDIIHSADLHQMAYPEKSHSTQIIFQEFKIFILQTFYNIIPLEINVPRTLVLIIRGVFIVYLGFSINYAVLRKDFRDCLPFIVISSICYAFFILLLLSFGETSVQFRYQMVLFTPLLFFLMV